MNLLILNYSMNPMSSVFSHQREVAVLLSRNFRNTFVITAEEIGAELSETLSLSSIVWKRRETLRNIMNFYSLAVPILFRKRKSLVVFSHMTEVQSFLIAPICWLLGIPHYLWYAHKSKSPFLFLSYPFLTGVITSTPGSCPIRGHKVHAIGQAIDHQVFSAVKSIPKNPPLCWYHVGRFDESKQIHLIIEVFRELRSMGWKVTLDLYGEPSAGSSNQYYIDTLSSVSLFADSNWFKYHGAITRTQLPKIAELHDGFVHAFQGSLDKAVLEGVMSKRVVVSINDEFLAEFGIQTESYRTLSEKLLSQMLQALNQSNEFQVKQIEARWKIAFMKHSLENWIEKLTKIVLK